MSNKIKMPFFYFFNDDILGLPIGIIRQLHERLLNEDILPVGSCCPRPRSACLCKPRRWLIQR